MPSSNLVSRLAEAVRSKVMDVALHVDASLIAGTVRYRVSVLARALRSQGLRVYAGPAYREALVHVFFKHFGDHRKHIDDLSGLKIFDITDNHFEGKHAQFYQEMMERCDFITVNSTVMYRLVSGLCGDSKRVQMIDDPYLLEGSLSDLKENGLFFGHASNFDALRSWNKSIDLPLVICSNLAPKGLDWPYTFVPFSVGNLEQCFSKAKVGLVLSSKPWSSANRILDCLVRRIPVIATKTEANFEVAGELKESVRWVGDTRSFDFLAASRELTRQDFGQYSELAIQQKWLNLFEEYTGVL